MQKIQILQDSKNYASMQIMQPYLVMIAHDLPVNITEHKGHQPRVLVGMEVTLVEHQTSNITPLFPKKILSVSQIKSNPSHWAVLPQAGLGQRRAPASKA